MDEALRLLKCVLAAAEMGSMRRVARTLGVRESTASRNICALEQQLDIQIFQRHNDGVRLTTEGRGWIERVHDHYAGLQGALSSTAQRNKNTEQLQIGLSAPFGREFIVRLVESSERRYPQIEVILQDGSCNKQVNAIRRRDLDIAFMCGGCDMRSCQGKTIWEG